MSFPHTCRTPAAVMGVIGSGAAVPPFAIRQRGLRARRQMKSLRNVSSGDFFVIRQSQSEKNLRRCQSAESQVPPACRLQAFRRGILPAVRGDQCPSPQSDRL